MVGVYYIISAIIRSDVKTDYYPLYTYRRARTSTDSKILIGSKWKF